MGLTYKEALYQVSSTFTLPLLLQVDYKIISATCNMFRALTDMYDSFYSVQSMIDYYSRDNYNMSAYARPGAWNDPDQVSYQLWTFCLNYTLKLNL